MSCKYSRAFPNLWVNAVVISRARLASVTRVMTDMALANVSLSTSLTLIISLSREKRRIIYVCAGADRRRDEEYVERITVKIVSALAQEI